MDILLFILGFLLLVGSLGYLVVTLIKKKFKGKRFAILIVSSFVLMIVGLSLPSSNTASEPKKEKAVETTAEPKKEKEPELTKEEKAELESKKKAEEEAKKKAEAEAKAKAEEEARVKAEQEAAARKQKAVANNKSITFPMLNKAADRYAGEPYYLKGEVVQALEEGNYTIMRINMTQESYGWTDTVWVEYPDITDAVEDNIVEVYGEILGSHTYDTAIGGQMTLPAIIASEVKVLQQ